MAIDLLIRAGPAHLRRPRRLNTAATASSTSLRADIPTKAAAYAWELGLPEIRPAARLYRALLSVGRDRPDTEKPMTPSAAALASWLPEDCRRAAADTLVAGRRIAQEWVGYRYLQQNDDWLIDLGGKSASDAPGGDPL
ncbi:MULTISPECIES: hypothetical protein [unclassified Saccharothrix]|uniref:hypothetical protein n=1 Tax=unclassified Saccharothrix TaxID=2593673 RepID=UPI00307D3745